MLVAAAAAADFWRGELDGGFAAGDEAIGAGLGLHAKSHLRQVAAGVLGGAFEGGGGVHGVRVAAAFGFEAGGIDSEGVVADDEVGDFARRAVVRFATHRHSSCFATNSYATVVRFANHRHPVVGAVAVEDGEGVGGGVGVFDGGAGGDDVEGIAEVYSVAGEVDLIAIVRVTRHDDLADVVTRRVAALPGIVETRTMVAFQAFSKRDLDALWDLGE